MPRFSGDVREYSIFRDDFKHAIESRYTGCPKKKYSGLIYNNF